MKICYLGTGVWGFCLASLLSGKGYEVTSWTTKKELAEQLNKTREHPLLPGVQAKGHLSFVTDIKKALDGADFIVESVTSAGLRPVFEQVKKIQNQPKPIVITSKGIEQHTGLILSEVIIDIFGEPSRSRVGYLSGPSYAEEVIKGLPTGVVSSAYDSSLTMQIAELFKTPTFRVYPNSDITGVALGGALKNIIAIACGIADGLNLGNSSKAALMTRGLHEIRKLAVAKGCKQETLYGLAGMGDLCLTCGSTMSRNFRFGKLIASGLTSDQAKQQIGMVVEGAYSALSALELSKELKVPMPITEAVHSVIYEGMKPKEAVGLLMQRVVKEEHL